MDEQNSRTAWNDREVDALLDHLVERAEERDDIDVSPESLIGRRTVLGGIAGAAGVGALAANVSAAPNWSNATGSGGTSSSPLTDVYASTGTFQTVATDDIDITSLQSGAEAYYLSAFDGNDRGTAQATKTTPGVSTTATSIFDFTAGSTVVRMARLLVAGTEDGASTYFLDEVNHVTGSSPNSSELNTRLTPAGRSYSLNAGNLELSMASGTYNVTVAAVLLDPETGD